MAAERACLCMAVPVGKGVRALSMLHNLYGPAVNGMPALSDKDLGAPGRVETSRRQFLSESWHCLCCGI